MLSHTSHQIHVFINHARISFEHPKQTGQSIKERACIPLDHVLCLDRARHEGRGEHGEAAGSKETELAVIDNCETISLKEGEHLFSHAVPAHGTVTVTINRHTYEFANAHQTGVALKERAGVVLSDVLFLDRPQEDEVIGDDQKITLKCGDTFHSAPPANYGNTSVDAVSVGFERFELLPQSDSWTYLIIHDYPLPEGFMPKSVRLLVKLPPLFPEAAPDMFWTSPEVRTMAGGAPQGTSIEIVLGEPWQRFSWHLQPGAWSPGMSTLRDFMRCVRSRLEKRN